MTTIGVLGLGNMGSRIARRYLNAGYEVVVWNRTPAKADALVEDGAALATTPVEAAERSDVAITMLADPDALLEVISGSSGLSTCTSRTTLLEMSTVGPITIERVSHIVPGNIDLLDTPVLGSTSEVEEGRLLVFAGGPDDVVGRVTPLLEELGRVMHVGPLGSGAAAKLVANSALLAALTAVGESVALGRRLGLDDDSVFEVLGATPLGAQAERRRQSIADDEYPLRFALALAHKDADLITDAARAVGLDMRVAHAAREWFIDAETAGFAERDYSTVLAHILAS